MEGNHYSEYYFDYKLRPVGVDGGAGDSKIESPRLYFERDYRKKAVPYSLSIIPREWVGHHKEYNDMIAETNRGNKVVVPPSIPYDKIHVVFGVGKVDYTPLLSRDSQEYKMAAVDKTFTFADFYGDNCHLTVDDAATEKSGAGVVEMYRGNEMIARFAFVVNCIRRKRITYEITKHSGQNSLDFRFTCKDRPQGLKVAIVHHESRLPCLREDLERNNIGTFDLNFTVSVATKGKSKGKEKGLYTGRLPEETVGTFVERGNRFAFVFAEEWMNRYYTLDCIRNDTAQIDRTDKGAVLAVAEHSCPFCHGVISGARGKDERYKKGGISCTPLKVGEREVKTAFLPKIYTSRGAVMKNCMYCSNDLFLDENQEQAAVRFSGEFHRLLPANFMDHQDFKIAFAGSARAGKTTYISRFFGIDGKDDTRVSMTMGKTAIGLKEFGIDVKSTMMEQISARDRAEGDRIYSYSAAGHSWEESKEHYIERRISLNLPHYPEATPEADYTRYPFIAEVNGKAYVSFYDIAGEDAQHRTTVGSLDTLSNKPIGVFCIVNGEKDTTGNQRVVDMLELGGLSPSCPVAVIVTKMDILENEFDPSSHCLRNDYFSKIKSYVGSEIEREINFASEEIKSYLQANGLDTEFQHFKNVKYFGVSSFNFGDSIHETGANNNARGSVYFDCSSKHLELPFLWMLKQFGVIN